MPKKQTKKIRAKASLKKLDKALMLALAAEENHVRPAPPPLPSHRAMNLAETFVKRAREAHKVPLVQPVTITIAEMIDAALRVDRASGIQKGTEDRDTEIVQSVMCRIGMNSLMKPGPKTIVLSFFEAKVLKRALEAAGYSDGIPRAHQQAWRAVTDDTMHDSITLQFGDSNPVAKAA